MRQGVEGQLRLLDLRRDFEGLSKLIELAFAEDFQRMGVQFQEELRAVRRLMPWVLLLGRFSQFFRELIGGYVWEDQGQIVGSVIAQPQGLERRKWYISTVATHPDYRRKGIARRLMEATIEHIRQRGGELVLLNVRADNTPAYLLYRRLGFVHFDSMTQLRLKAMPLFVRVGHSSRPSVPEIIAAQADAAKAVLPVSYTLRPMGLGEWRARYELAKEAISPEVQAFNPLSEREFRISLGMRALSPFFNLLQGVRDHWWAVEHGGRVVGVLTLRAVRYDSLHQLRIIVHPQHEAIAEALLVKGLGLLEGFMGRGVLASVPNSRPELRKLFMQYGFVEVSTFHQMGLKLK